MKVDLETRNREQGRWRLFRILAISALALLAFTCLAGALAILWLRHAMEAQLPVIDGEVRLPGLSAPVRVKRDAHGIPHIRAANMDDLLEAQGFVVAQDRLWQMDMARRFSAGDLAEVLGPDAVEHDRVQRVLQMRPTAERLAATMPAEQKRLFEDYARGVNTFIASQEGHLPAEFRLLRYQPKPWQPVDSWLVALNMVQRLDSFYPTKLSRETIEAELPANLAAQLYPTTTWRDRPPTQSIPGITAPPGPASGAEPKRGERNKNRKPQPPPQERQPGATSDTNDLLHLRDVLNFLSPPCDLCRPGSNEWAVTGAHTASGKAMLSNDMHLEHSIPDIWHQEDLEAGGFHVEGVTTPGIPLIIAGHNAHIAWGFTTLNGDVQDIYVEKTNEQGEYWTSDGWRKPEQDREHIRVRGHEDVILDLERTDHGPVITPLLPHEKRMLALKWTLYDPAVVGLPLENLDAASNWTEFRKALSQWWVPTQNVAYADDQGHIGYQAVGLFPMRPAGLSAIPIVVQGRETGAGSGDQHEWQGWIPFEQMPTVLDPPEGIVATANSRVTPDGYPYPLTLDWAEPYRNERIWKWLASKDKLTPADMLTLETDVYSEVDRTFAQRFAYAIDHASKVDARLRTAADLLRSWNGRVEANSAAAQIVDATKRALWPLVLEPKLGADWKVYTWQNKDFAQEQMLADTPAEWLPAGYKSWDDLIAAAVSKGMIDEHAPRSLNEWTYGSQHRIDLKHPLYGLLPFFNWTTSTGSHPLSGDESTVNQVRGLLGPSQRFTMDWSNVDGSTENIVVGQSGDPASPYYLDQWPFWYAGKTFSVPFTDAAVDRAAKHTLQLTP
jgi:penicillin G amidase